MQDTTYGIYISTPEGGTITEQFSINIDNLGMFWHGKSFPRHKIITAKMLTTY